MEYARPMKLIDTHTHLFLEQFSTDRNEVVARALTVCDALLLPNIDGETLAPMLGLCDAFAGRCFPMIGLHPCYVEPDPHPQLDALEPLVSSRPDVVAIGEAGLDLYWDKTTLPQQIVALDRQLEWAKRYGLPIALHTREATAQTLDRIRAAQDGRLTGVLHCFSGTAAEARQALDLNFKLGIGGPITYSRTLPDALKGLPETALVLETDSPYLAPVPYRGKRNESAYLHLIAEALQQRVWHHLTLQQTLDQTTANAMALFPVLARQFSAINTHGAGA